MADEELNKGKTGVSRLATEEHHHYNVKKVVPLVMGCIAALLLLIYVISVLHANLGNFTVSVNKFNEVQHGLSLSETLDFSQPTADLKCSGVEKITNIDGKTLDALHLGAVDGEDSGLNYLCYTFYLKNRGTDIIDCSYGMVIANMTMGVEKAVRVRIMSNRNGENGKTVDYARASGTDENGNAIPEEGTVPFFSKDMVMQDTIEQFAPDEYCKFTVVIWLEGNDPECVDAILGGEFTVSMKFMVTSVSDISD